MAPADKAAIAQHFRALAADHTSWGQWYGTRGNFRQADRHHKAASEYRQLAARCVRSRRYAWRWKNVLRPVAVAGVLAATMLGASVLAGCSANLYFDDPVYTPAAFPSGPVA